MNPGHGLRLALAGATGVLGREVVAVIEERRLPIRSLRAFGTDQSMGCEVELFGEDFPVECEPPPFSEVDLMIVCAPPRAALELVRQALHAQVPCIDCSGALSGSLDVPLLVSGVTPASAVVGAPVVSTPAGQALSWSLVLHPLERTVGLSRVVGTALHSSAGAGRRGIDALSEQSIALLSQQEVPENDLFPTQVAFDCVPLVGHAEEGHHGPSSSEADLVRDLHRLVGDEIPIAVHSVQVPTFVGDGAALALETREAITPEEAAEIFGKAEGVEIWSDSSFGPTTRDTSGRDGALVGRLRADPSREHGLLLWLAADPLRLAASNAVKLTEVRLSLN